MDVTLIDGYQDTEALAKAIRIASLKMSHHAKSSHIGPCLSIADILAVLYGQILRVDPTQSGWRDRDRFILSKGHGGAALYATLALRGFFPMQWLEEYCDDGSFLGGHVTHHNVPGIEVSTGSLGHGLSIACGMALAAKKDKRPYRVFCLISDGECNEGSIWEAALFASHHKLDNLIAIVDYNQVQGLGPTKDILDLCPICDKWESFGWSTTRRGGHMHFSLSDAFSVLPIEIGKPSIIVAWTTKGRGVSFMENKLEWHYRSPNDKQLANAIAEIEEAHK